MGARFVMQAAVKVAVTVEPELLRSVDASARRRGISRSRFVTESLRAAILAEREAEIRATIDMVCIGEGAGRAQTVTAAQFLAASVIREGCEEW